jgi:fructose-1,6-bisphosphatase I
MRDEIGMTLERFIIEEQKVSRGATGEFSGLLSQITLAGKLIYREVHKAGLAQILGLTGKINVQGEEVRKLDEFANYTFVHSLDHSGYLCGMASEEVADVIPIPDEFPCGTYVVCFDPLDGSSNIDVNINIGSIFSILRKVSDEERGAEQDILQKGTAQVAAGYILYGSSTMLVYSTGQGVNGFTLDPSLGEFLLSHPNITIPEKGKIYSVNEGNWNKWDDGVRNYITYLKQKDPDTSRPYTARYIGSLVADFHRNLLKGGIFMYPADKKNPHGKLRLLYEANPLSFLVEQAGGASSNGHGRIMEIMPDSLHQRVPLYIGSKEDVKTAEEFVQGKR